MNEAEFRKWMVDQGHSLATQNTQAQDAKRLEAHYGDLDEAFDADGLEGIKAELDAELLHPVPLGHCGQRLRQFGGG